MRPDAYVYTQSQRWPPPVESAAARPAVGVMKLHPRIRRRDRALLHPLRTPWSSRHPLSNVSADPVHVRLKYHVKLRSERGKKAQEMHHETKLSKDAIPRHERRLVSYRAFVRKA